MQSRVARRASAGFLFAEALEGRQLLTSTIVGDQLRVTGTANNDNIRLTQQNGQVNVFFGTRRDGQFAASAVKSILVKGGAGNDKMTVASSFRIPVTLDGGDGSDLITGGKGREKIVGGNGNDTAQGGSGNDSVQTGGGNDVILGGGGNDNLRGDGGNDLMYGDAGNDMLFGGEGKDTLGGDDEDKLTFNGNAGSDVVGNDMLNGGADADWLLGGTRNGVNLLDSNGQDTFIGGGGNDTIDPRGGDDTIKDLENGDFRPIEEMSPAREQAGDPHTHVALLIQVRGKKGMQSVFIPNFVGGIQGVGFKQLHTHSDSPQDEAGEGAAARIHFESGTNSSYALREFFQIWGVSFSSTHVGRFFNMGKKKVKMTVRDIGNTKFENYRPGEGDVIVVTFG